MNMICTFVTFVLFYTKIRRYLRILDKFMCHLIFIDDDMSDIVYIYSKWFIFSNIDLFSCKIKIYCTNAQIIFIDWNWINVTQPFFNQQQHTLCRSDKMKQTNKSWSANKTENHGTVDCETFPYTPRKLNIIVCARAPSNKHIRAELGQVR